MPEKDAIKNVLDSMLGSINQENIELYKKLMDVTGFKSISNPNDFFYSMVYPYENFLTGLIITEISSNENLQFLMIHSNYVENHFNKLIVEKEGSPCSSDKSRTIVSALFHWFKDDKIIKWDYDSEYTYHLPKKIFTTHDDILRFYMAIKKLYYGIYKDYITELNSLIKIQ